MNPGLRRLHRVVVCLLVAGAAVSMRASADWASAGALGDVAIAFDNEVQPVRQRGRGTEVRHDRYRRARRDQHRTRVQCGVEPVGHQHRRPGKRAHRHARLRRSARVYRHAYHDTGFAAIACHCRRRHNLCGKSRRHDSPVHQDRSALSDVHHRHRLHGMHRHRPQPRSEHAVRGVRWQKHPNDNRSGEAQRSRAGRNLYRAATARHGVRTTTVGATGCPFGPAATTHSLANRRRDSHCRQARDQAPQLARRSRRDVQRRSGI